MPCPTPPTFRNNASHIALAEHTHTLYTPRSWLYHGGTPHPIFPPQASTCSHSLPTHLSPLFFFLKLSKYIIYTVLVAWPRTCHCFAPFTDMSSVVVCSTASVFIWVIDDIVNFFVVRTCKIGACVCACYGMAAIKTLSVFIWVIDDIVKYRDRFGCVSVQLWDCAKLPIDCIMVKGVDFISCDTSTQKKKQQVHIGQVVVVYYNNKGNSSTTMTQ